MTALATHLRLVDFPAATPNHLQQQVTKAIDEAKKTLINAFDKVTFSGGKVHNYLKMKFDYTHDDYLSVTQFGFIHALPEFYNIEETELVPAEPQ